jgi:hypothetical protein
VKCVSPFGCPVVPEVNMIRAGSSGVVCTGLKGTELFISGFKMSSYITIFFPYFVKRSTVVFQLLYQIVVKTIEEVEALMNR